LNKILKNPGFTLIELVVVISLISIMLFFTVPKFQRAVSTDNSKQISRWIMVKVPALKERAIRQQKRYILHVGIDTNRMWVTNESMSEEETRKAAENGYELPGDMTLLDVEYADGVKLSDGRADIRFYKKGYSDKALIHIEDEDNNQMSFVVEPFLSSVKLHNKYVGFEG